MRLPTPSIAEAIERCAPACRPWIEAREGMALERNKYPACIVISFDSKLDFSSVLALGAGGFPWNALSRKMQIPIWQRRSGR